MRNLTDEEVIMAFSYCAVIGECKRCPIDNLCEKLAKTTMHNLVEVPEFLAKRIVGIARLNTERKRLLME